MFPLTAHTIARAMNCAATDKDFRFGANYRAEQDSRSCLQWLANLISNIVTLGCYGARTAAEIDAKSEALEQNFFTVAEAILKLDSNGTRIVALRVNGQSENFTISAVDGVVVVTHGTQAVTLQQDLPTLKRGMLRQYIAHQQSLDPDQPVVMQGFNLTGVDLSWDGPGEYFSLRDCHFPGAIVDRANFSGRHDLAKISLKGVRGEGANFSGAKMMRAQFNGANLPGANFAYTDLYEALFDPDEDGRTTTLTGTTFKGADARRVNFTAVSLSGNLDEVNASRANFRDVTFGEITGTPTDITDAAFDTPAFERLIDQWPNLSWTKIYNKETSDQIVDGLNVLSGEKIPLRLFYDLPRFACECCCKLTDLPEQIKKEYDEGAIYYVTYEQMQEKMKDPGIIPYLREKMQSDDGLDQDIQGILIRIMIKTDNHLRNEVTKLRLDRTQMVGMIAAKLAEKGPPGGFSLEVRIDRDKRTAAQEQYAASVLGYTSQLSICLSQVEKGADSSLQSEVEQLKVRVKQLRDNLHKCLNCQTTQLPPSLKQLRIDISVQLAKEHLDKNALSALSERAMKLCAEDEFADKDTLLPNLQQLSGALRKISEGIQS